MAYLAFASGLIDGDHIKAAGLVLQFVDVVIPFGNTFELFLLSPVDGVFGLSIREIIRPCLDFDKHKLIAIHGDNIDLADPAVREIPFDDPVAQIRYESAGFVLAFMASGFALRLKWFWGFHNTFRRTVTVSAL